MMSFVNTQKMQLVASRSGIRGLKRISCCVAQSIGTLSIGETGPQPEPRRYMSGGLFSAQ